MSILVYSRTLGFRHDSIPTAIETIGSFGYNATFTEDPSYFANTTSLAQYGALVFLSTTGEILDAEQKANLESYLVGGGGLVGIHSATDSLTQTPFYGTALGAYFQGHPELQNATFQPVNVSHPSTADLPTSWNYVEEVYNFKSDPRDTNVTLLLTVDPDSYQDSNRAAADTRQGTPHPIAWCRDSTLDLGNGTATNGINATNGTTVEQGTFVANGRMWYTSLGHTIEAWQDPIFQSHIRGGIDWVLSIANGTTTDSANTTAGMQPAAGKPSSTGLNTSGSATSTTCRAKTATACLLLLSLLLTVG